MKTPWEWFKKIPTAEIDGLLVDIDDAPAWIKAIQAEAFAAGAEAQREKTADRARNELMKIDLWVSEFIRETPLVTLPKGEG